MTVPRLRPGQVRAPNLNRARIAPFNADAYLSLPSPYSGINDYFVHPDVLRIPGGWNGYEYWMAVTTYAEETKEDPCVLVSNDRLTWTAPPGLTNPLGAGINKDVDLAIHEGTAYLYWVQNLQDGPNLRLRTSTDGSTWTAVQSTIPGSAIGLSPAIVHDGTTWLMYTAGGGEFATEQLVYRTASSPSGPWSAAQAAGYTPPTYGQSGVHNIWHLDAFRFNGRTYLLINESALRGKNLRFAVSTDGVNFTPSADPLMTTPSDTWDGGMVYRATAVVRPLGDLMWIWYSATGPLGWHVGYTEVPTALLPSI